MPSGVNWTEAEVSAFYQGRNEAPPGEAVEPVQQKRSESHSSRMNKTETAYAGYLELRKMAGEVKEYEFAPVTLKLGHDCRYTPDFLVLLTTGAVEFHEVKGSKKKRNGKTGAYYRDDAIVKIKWAAPKFRAHGFTFVMVWELPYGEWAEKKF